MLARLPLVSRPLTPDEGGFLLVGSQWSPGSSLYGNYWVDRPPLLIGIFGAAGELGGTIPLRVIGVVAVVCSVLLAFELGVIANPRDGARDDESWAAGLRVLAPAAVCAVFLTSPAFGAPEIDGELLAVPWVLAGTTALLLAHRAEASRRRVAYGVAAGVCAAAALLTKQNVVDVFAVALVVACARTRRGARRDLVIAFALGSGGALVAGVMAAWSRGTSPWQLWLAIGPFRWRASEVLRTYSPSRVDRAHDLVAAVVLSGAALVVAAASTHLLLHRKRDRVTEGSSPLATVGVVLLVWESIAIASGGSYWSHYLTGLVPGLVTLTAATLEHPGRLLRGISMAIVLAAVSASIQLARLGPGGSADTAVADFIRTRSRTSDSVVVCFGHPDVIWQSGLSSPYPLVWSLPVSVKDPRLHLLDKVLEDRSRPTWVVVRGGLGGWGLPAARTQRILSDHFRLVRDVDSTAIYHEIHGPRRVSG
jgi:4-amino-4-deoxy-L-arabinose transferase-like glycosyltransferase